MAGEKPCTCRTKAPARHVIAPIMLSVMMPACALLIGLVLLAGCAAAPPAPIVETRIQVERVSLPAGLLSCEAKPAPGTWSSQADVADYIVRLDEAYDDCAGTVRAIAQIEASAPPDLTQTPTAEK